jgi:septal ring factor EnvC (AmiA/AmiB activator)
VSDEIIPGGAQMAPIYILVGGFVVKEALALGRDWVRGLSEKNAKREETDKESLTKRVDEHDEKFEELDDANNELGRKLDGITRDLKGAADTLSELRGSINTLKTTFDERVEKQAQHHREAMKEQLGFMEKKVSDLEFLLRGEITRALSQTLGASTTKRRPSSGR